MKIKIPDDVAFIMHRLDKNGYEAFVVGGCVRDSLLGIEPNDWDICTNAEPLQTKQCFADLQIYDAGIKHGTVSVVYKKNVYEITTYRIDGKYSDNRHPDNVMFTKNLKNDLSRRDFTINSMAYNDNTGLIDPFGGKNDIKNKLIRCVGIPDCRFSEDALRIMRALRFASVYNYSIEELTLSSLRKNKKLLLNIASERINAELNKLLCGTNAEQILNDNREVFAVFIPEIKEIFDFQQNTPHHNRDVWHHTTCAVNSVEPTPLLRVTMLLHDLGKPEMCKTDENGINHFKGHPHISACKANIILHRLKYSNEFINDCLLLIKFHDVRFSGSKRQIKHVMSKIGEKNFELLLKVQRADIMAQSTYRQKDKLAALDLAGTAYKEILEEKDCFTLKQLAVNGNDLINIGITRSHDIGSTLKYLLSLVIDSKIKNEKQVLLKKAAEVNNLEIIPNSK